MNRSTLDQSVEFVRRSLAPARPLAAMILGSGWSDIASAFPRSVEIDYRDIPGLGPTQVEGHSGSLLMTTLADREILIFRGRRHWYEGAGWEPVAIPVYISVKLGFKTLVLTNAAGAIEPSFKPGDVMLIDDHINMLGANPLVGAHNAAWGQRFPDMSRVYDRDLLLLMEEAASSVRLPCRHGIYAAVSGPSYETPAEIRAIRAVGADAIGMSTVPEAILAHAAGMRVAGVSCITNAAAGATGEGLSHARVLEEVRRAQPGMKALLVKFMETLADPQLASFA